MSLVSLLYKRPYEPPLVTAEAMHEKANDLIERAQELLVQAREQYGRYVEENTSSIGDRRSENTAYMEQIAAINELLDVLP